MIRGLKPLKIEQLLTSLDRVIIFGAGGAGRDAIRVLRQKNIDVMFVCDNDLSKHGTCVEGVKVCPAKILRDYQKEVVLIASDFAREIGLQLKTLGVASFYYFGYCHDYERWNEHFNPSNIENSLSDIEQALKLFDEESKLMYERMVSFRITSDPTLLIVSEFDDYWHPSAHPLPEDNIIDGGAWIGNTACRFAKQLNRRCKIYSFEPNWKNFEKLQENIIKNDLQSVVEPIRLGLWRIDTCLGFNDSVGKTDQFRIDDNFSNKIHVISLDHFSQTSGKIDLIKMDIEGAEYDAILGASNVIREFAPKLQICIYHKPDDLWRIPLLVKEINPDYKFYLGVHKQNFIDTVLYAAVK